jgi:ribosomal-protein-alanine N-acetyltransferase
MGAVPPEPQLRPARLADIDEIHRIEREAFPNPPWSRNSFVVLVDDRRVSFLVAANAVGGSEVPGYEIVGYVVTWIVADEAEIANLAVRADRRRSGIGRSLVEAAVSAAVAGGAQAMYLEVRQSNVAARALYEHRGFVAVGKRLRYYRNPSEDALVLRLDLDRERRQERGPPQPVSGLLGDQRPT